ncbi:CvpA family protein [Dongia sp.]|uniref:CvpA family protein n=1 Tax=Dongia sp. TaxID=1977262 RepID=UPI0035ADD2AC
MNFLDLIVLGVIGLSTLLAFSRGFIKELLSILGWIGAVIATVALFSPVRIMVRQYIPNELLADISAGIGIFVVTLVLCGMLNHWISAQVRGNGLGALDRSLGLVFGLARGSVVICAAYILMVWALPNPTERPDMVNQARFLPVVERGAAFLLKLLPDDILKTGEDAINRSLDAVEQGQALGNALQTISPGVTGGATTNGTDAAGAGQSSTNTGAAPQEPGGQDAGSGYKDAERNDLNRLIQGSE